MHALKLFYFLLASKLQLVTLFVFAEILRFLPTQITTMKNYYDLILQGAKLAKTPQQQATVEYYAKGIETKLANIDRMLTELEKPDPRLERAKVTSTRLARLLK